MQARNLFPLIVLALVLALYAGPTASAQTTAESPTVTHTHYAGPDASDPALGPTTTEGHLAPRLQNLGDYHFAITTKSELGQKFFDQGFRLAYGFNHMEAGRAFAEAARLDPEAAMAYWGQALVLGPNINAPMNPDDEPTAYELVQKARSLGDKVTERERDYIEALAARYSGKAEERKARDRAYSEAMRKLSEKYPDDLDAAALYAESLMDLRPWNYWTLDGEPYEETKEVVRALESVLHRDPNHPGAIHFYIHAMELVAPQKAEPYADRLGDQMPGAGHMVHMPSHIYMRVGRYEDAAAANVRAVAADEDYITQCRAQGIYPLGYYPHNIHFLWAASTMEGRSQVAIEAARKVASKIPQEMLDSLPLMQSFVVAPYFALIRFGQWDAILAEPQPSQNQLFLVAMWHYARGMAYTAKGDTGEAAKELASLTSLLESPEMAKVMPSFSDNSAVSILSVAQAELAGELAAKKGEYEKAIASLHRGVLLEDSLIYNEPADWHYPVRQSLGAVLLEAGRPLEAEMVYWDDLRRNPENGWSLFGLAQALRAQGKIDQAGMIEKRFDQAWAKADIKLTGSRFMTAQSVTSQTGTASGGSF